MNYRENLENTLKQFIDRKCDKADMYWLRDELLTLILTAKREAVKEYVDHLYDKGWVVIDESDPGDFISRSYLKDEDINEFLTPESGEKGKK